MLLCPKTCLFANHGSSSTCIMVLPKLTFVLLCAPFLSSLVHKWRFVVQALWLWCETRVSPELAGVSLILFYAWNVVLHVQRARSEMKHSDTQWLSHTPTFKWMNGKCTLTIKHSVFSVMSGLIVEILFMLFFVHNGLKMSEYKAYWIMGFPLIYSWARTKKYLW